MTTEEAGAPRSVSQSSSASGAVFLSYASEDAPVAHRIAAAMCEAGIEVWFDRSELRGGDAWDRQIRKQIRDCALFMPVVSAHSQARHEGYFRLEWDLADQRTHLMGRNRAFIVPVCTDSLPERDADVPDSFLAVQWTRLPGGETSAAFVGRIRRLLTGEASSGAKGSAPADSGSRARGRSQRLMYAAVAAAAAVVLAVGYLTLGRLIGSQPPAPGAASIAVLPLANESGEASQQYFSDGISEDLITALGQFPGLKVIGRSSSFQFRDSKEDSRSVGAKLGVAHLLEGSVRKSGDMIRVSAELIDTVDGSMQWSERYDRPYKDLFALQDEITRAVVAALRTKLLPGEYAAAQSQRPPGGSLEAYNSLLQGEFYFLRQTEADYRKSIEYFTQATQLDPRYALAWSGLSRVWSDLSANYLDGAPAQQAYSRAREAADRAIALSPDLAAAHVARGRLLEVASLDWRGGEAEFRRAVALAPNDGDARYWLGKQFATYGELDQAIQLTRQALATEPLRANWYRWLALYLSGLNRLDEAERAIRRAIELQPAAAIYHQTLAIIEVQRRNPQAALEAAQQEPPGWWQDHALALARQIGSDRSAADAALRTLIKKDANVAAYQIAQVYALRNDDKETFAWLDLAWSNRDGGIAYLLFDPFILRYKADPRFAAFCRKVSLPPPGAAAAHRT